MPSSPCVFSHFNWPRAYPTPTLNGQLKTQPDDFRVDEIPQMQPSGEGEHVWFWVEKRGVNTGWVAVQLAKWLNVNERDVSFAGLKDRHAVTKQWFSVYDPKGTATAHLPDLNNAPEPLTPAHGVTLLNVSRHHKKLRRGELLGNRFAIVLNALNTCDVEAKAQAEHTLEHIAHTGVPNYFGAQRFGFGGQNIERARTALVVSPNKGHKRKPVAKKALYLSALRSFMFNQILAERIRQDCWHTLLEGDIATQEAKPSPTAALWGRGTLATSDAALALEQRISEQWADDCLLLEHQGLNQERRATRCTPEGLRWQWQDDTLTLWFSLPAGQYATSVLREIANTFEPERHTPLTPSS